MEQIRVLHLLTALVSGGVQRVVLGYADQVAPYGVTFDYLVQGPGQPDVEARVRESGSRVFPIPPVNGNPFVFYRALRRFLKSHPEYRILHVHQNYLNWLPLLTARLAGVRVRVSHSHSNRQSGSPLVRVIRCVLRFFITACATDLWACSEPAYGWLYGRKNKRKYILSNAVDERAFTFDPAVRDRVRAERDAGSRFVCVCVGTLSTIKNQGLLLEAFRSLPADRYALWLVGDGPERAALAQKIADLGLADCASLLGDRADVPDLLSASDCFLLPSLNEGLGVSVIEAQINGLPCLVSDRVPSQVNISGSVAFLGVGAKDAPLWAGEITRLAAAAPARSGMEPAAVLASGYAITRQAEELAERYKEMNAR